MIEIVRFNTDQENWYNSLLQELEAPYLYAYPWFLKAVSGSVVMAHNPAKTFALLFIESEKLGVRYLPYSNFVQQFQPVGKVTQHQLDELHNAFLRRYWKIDFRAHYSLTCEKIAYQKAQNFELYLNSSLEALKASFGSNHKRAIKKAEKHTLKAEFTNEQKWITTSIDWFKLHNRAGEKLPLSYYETLVRIAQAAQLQNALEILVVYQAKEPIATCVLVHSKNRITLLFTASLPEAKEVGGNHFAIYKIIEKYAETSKILDFEGSNNRNLAFFYKNFGSSTVDYFVWQKKNLPFAKLKKA